MKTRTEYGIRRTVALPWEKALARIRETLKDQGFGILTEIDLKEKLKEKIGVDIKPYVILGACNPPLAYKALQAEPEIGLLLPCNVIVYEIDGHSSVVAAIDPDTMVELVGDDVAIAAVARDARQRLERALAAV